MTRIPLLCYALAVLVYCIPAINADNAEFVAGVLRDAGTSSYVAQPCDGTQLTTCQSCNTIELCLGGIFDSLNLTRTCPSTAPYCALTSTGATCQSSPDSQCSVNAEFAFACTGTGFFPDPDSCQTYHYCEQKNQIGDTYDCPDGYRYNTQRNLCQRYGSRRCQAVQCDPLSQNVFVPYLFDDEYYVYCQYDYSTATPTYKKAYMLSCGKGSKFVVKSQVCQFQCRRVGFFVNTANPNQYFSCYRSGFRWVAEVRTCSKYYYIFDETLNRCKEDPDAVTTTTSTTTEMVTEIVTTTAETTSEVVTTTQPSPTEAVTTTQPSPTEVITTTQPSPTDVVTTTQPSPTEIVTATEPSPTEVVTATEPITTEDSVTTIEPTVTDADTEAPEAAVRLSDTFSVKRGCLGFLRDLLRNSNYVK
ncbi:uncharacterized protein LOC134222574 [Armigeres subalbatus]|uniref:uncharacterized protein LOC134222574 n=1 Tax=Armigeres subalbatus TaxID=124917 RepID=UPI002ED066C6